MKEEAVVEQPVQPITQPRNSHRGLKCAVVIMSILALGGVGFGIYEMLQNSDKDRQISELKVQVENNNTADLKTPGIATTTEDNATAASEPTTPVTASENTQEYIYVGAWGLKIKIPQDLMGVSYSYHFQTKDALCVSGTKGGGQYGPEFADINKNKLGCISRGTGDNYIEGESPWWDDPKQAQFSLDGYYYWVQGPQAVYTQNESERQWEIDSVQLIKEILSNPDNYSKI